MSNQQIGDVSDSILSDVNNANDEIRLQIVNSVNGDDVRLQKNEADISKCLTDISNLQKAVSELTETLKEKCNMPKWVYWVWLVGIIALAVSLTTFFCSVFPSVNWNVEAVSAGIVLTFVGVLATFVVISNLAQVSDVKNDVKTAIKELQEKVGTFEKTMSKNILEIAEKAMNKAKHEVMGTTLYNIAEISLDNAPQHAFLNYLKAIAQLHMEDPQNVEIDLCFDRLYLIIDMLHKQKRSIAVAPQAKNTYLGYLDGIMSRRKDGIAQFIMNLPTVQ